MDYYANDSLGAWTVNNELHRPVRNKPKRTQKSKTVVKSSTVKSGCECDAPCVESTSLTGQQNVNPDNVT